MCQRNRGKNRPKSEISEITGGPEKGQSKSGQERKYLFDIRFCMFLLLFSKEFFLKEAILSFRGPFITIKNIAY